MGVLADLYNEQRRYPESAAMLGLIAGSSRRLYGDTNPATVISYYNWGAKLQDMGDDRAAEPAFRQALALHDGAQGGDQPYVAATLNALGKAVGARGDRVACDSLQAAGLAMRRRLFGNVHSEVAWSLHAMGDARHERGDHAARCRSCASASPSATACSPRTTGSAGASAPTWAAAWSTSAATTRRSRSSNRRSRG